MIELSGLFPLQPVMLLLGRVVDEVGHDKGGRNGEDG